MKILKNTTLGYYMPSFFFLNVATEDDLTNLDLLSDDDKSTLSHEYVHFLQDITTIYGLCNICAMVDMQKAINEKILTSPQPTFKVPVIIDPSSPTSVNEELFNHYVGDVDLDLEDIQFINNIRLVENGKILGFEKVPSIIVEYTETNGMKGMFNFGSACVMETMAYMIEDRLYDCAQPPFFPYKIAKEVCRYIYPALANDDLNIILLCDIAMNSTHPGKFFYDFITVLEEKHFVPSAYSDFYAEFEKYTFTDSQGQKLDIYQTYKKYGDLAKGQLNDYFTNHIFGEVREWFGKIIDLGIDFRNKNISFWVDVLKYPTKQERISAFNLLTNVFGFPLMTNNHEHYFFHHPQINTDKIVALRAINEINELTAYGQQGCGMKKFCSQPVNITSSLCDEPWKQVKELQHCPFAQIWGMWGLGAKEPDFTP